MDITFRSVSAACAVSGQALVPGSRVRSYLYRIADGMIERADVLEGQQAGFAVEANSIICSWVHRIREKDVTEAEQKRASLQSSEEVFLSLYEEGQGDQDAMTTEARDRLKFFLALQLERKRILKPLGRHRYRHVASKRELTVPDIEITPELVSLFQQEIDLMSGG